MNREKGVSREMAGTLETGGILEIPEMSVFCFRKLERPLNIRGHLREDHIHIGGKLLAFVPVIQEADPRLHLDGSTPEIDLMKDQGMINGDHHLVPFHPLEMEEIGIGTGITGENGFGMIPAQIRDYSLRLTLRS